VEKIREKTVTRSFRIKESAFEALQEEAEKRNISINTMMNLLLASFAEYDRFLEEFHMLKLSQSTLTKILQASTTEAIKEAGRKAGGTLPKSFVLAKHGRVSQETLLEYLTLLSRYANLFELNITRNSGHITVTLVHDLGTKGSDFLGEYVRTMLKEAGYDDSIEFDEHSVTLNIQPRVKSVVSDR